MKITLVGNKAKDFKIALVAMGVCFSIGIMASALKALATPETVFNVIFAAMSGISWLFALAGQIFMCNVDGRKDLKTSEFLFLTSHFVIVLSLLLSPLSIDFFSYKFTPLDGGEILFFWATCLFVSSWMKEYEEFQTLSNE